MLGLETNLKYLTQTLSLLVRPYCELVTLVISFFGGSQWCDDLRIIDLRFHVLYTLER